MVVGARDDAYEAFLPESGHRSPVYGEREQADLDFASDAARLGRGQADGDDFGIGEAHRRNAAFVPTAPLPRDDLGYHFALRHRAMREHGFARGVADRVDPTHRGSAFIDDAQEPTVHVQHEFLASPAVEDRPAADGDENPVRGEANFLMARILHQQGVRLRRQPFRLGPDQHLDAQRVEPPRDGAGQLGVVLRENRRLGFDDGDLGAHLGEGGPQFQADIAGADDDDASRNLAEREGLGRGNHRTAKRQRGQRDGRRAGRDHDRLGADDLGARLRFDDDGLAVAELGDSLDDLDLAPLQETRDAARQPPDDSVLPGDRFRQRDFRAADRNPERAFAGRHARNFCKFIGRVDERLGRDAANVEARPAERIRLDDHRVDAQLPRADGADIAAGSRADDQEFASDLFHHPSTNI